MNKKKTLKTALAVVGILSLLIWMGIGDTLQGTMFFVAAITIALILHLINIEPEVTETKIGKTIVRTEDVPPPQPEKTPEQKEEELKANKKAELEAQLAALDKPLSPVPQPPKKETKVSKERQCQFCDKVCRNETDFKRHIAFKHLDKIKLEIA